MGESGALERCDAASVGTSVRERARHSFENVGVWTLTRAIERAGNAAHGGLSTIPAWVRQDAARTSFDEWIETESCVGVPDVAAERQPVR